MEVHGAVLLIAFAGVVALIAHLILTRIREPAVQQLTVPVSDVPRVYERLEREGQELSFAAFMFGAADPADAGETLNVQFSVEDGRIGFDWVLLAPGNLTERDRFVNLATARGYAVDSREMNGVSYLRVEDGGSLPALCLLVMKEVGGLGPDDQVGLVVDGFDWIAPPGAAETP